MSILWKNPAAASRDGILRSWGCLGYLIQLASLARESAFVKKLQISTTFERSGRPARRRLSFIGSQNPNQTKSTQKGAFCLAGGNTLDFSAHLPSIVREGAFVGEPQVPTTFERSGRPARRRLTSIGSQSPNQTKKAPFQVPFCLASGNREHFRSLGHRLQFWTKRDPERK